MKNHYDTLGVTLQSSDAEIKRAYRKLAVLLHPDKNPLPEAEAAFKEVNAAYEVLSDPIARGLYNQLLTNVSNQQPITPLHRDPAYRKRQQAGYKPQRPAGPSERVLMMRQSLPLLSKFAWLSCVWILILGLDYFLPYVISEEKVITDSGLSHTMVSRGYKSDRLTTDKGHHFPITYNEIEYFPSGSVVKVSTSRLLKILVTVESEKKYQLTNLASLYHNFSFAPIVLLILSIITIIGKWGIEFQFNLGVVIFLILILNVIFLYISVL